MSGEQNKGLTQDDFRKLIQTPAPQKPKNLLGSRPSRSKTIIKDIQDSEISNPYITTTIKSKANKGSRNFNHSSFTPRNIRNENENLGYRDRAEERRRGINLDYQDSEGILANLNSMNKEMDRMDSYNQSKYLGGDEKHTHLVKGLDYTLLKKSKANIEDKVTDSDEEITDDLFKLYVERQKNLEMEEDGIHLGEPAFMTGLGERIYHSQFTQATQLNKECFAKGRMAYIFDLEVDDYASINSIPTTLLRSKAELDIKDKTFEDTSKAIVQKVSDIFYNLRNKPLEAVDASFDVGASFDIDASTVQRIVKKPKIEADLEVSMFSDVSSDYELDIEAEILKGSKKKSTTNDKK